VAGLIVVGNQGLGARFSRLRHFLIGSVLEKVTRYARCSVMVIRKDLFGRLAEGGCPKSRGLDVLTQEHEEVILCGLFR
jgi:Universal stress protein family